MSQQLILNNIHSDSLQRLKAENAKLQQYLAAQRVVIASLERRAGRSLEALGVYVKQISGEPHNSANWCHQLDLMQNEVSCLSDLLSDAMVLQKLEAGKVEVKLEPLDMQTVLPALGRHLLDPKDGNASRFVCKVDATTPPVLADHDLTEAVITDLLARGLKYSELNFPVVLEADGVDDWLQVRVTAQRFAPVGNRDFATEIVLCCRRIEVQGGEVTCQHHPDGLQTVVISLKTASDLAF